VVGVTSTASIGRLLIIAGIALIVLGLVVALGGRLPRLPGDMVIERPNVTVHIPLGTMILVSIVLTVILNALLRR